MALLASNFAVPFVHLTLAEDVQRARDLVGHRIVLRAHDDAGECNVRLIDLEGVLDPATIDSILALKAPEVLDIVPLESFGALSAPTAGLQLSDIRFFGGKAANSGMLRRAIPDHSPMSLAFSFDLWNGFMDQEVGNGRTLREEIAFRLKPYGYPPNLQALTATLAGIQQLIRDASFNPALRAAVLAALADPQYAFDPARNLRFRSSTNIEDTEHFTGAGLYDSFSGCPADDLDQGGGGPSLCDSTESSERGVFRAIRKVFASFYNRNAYLERLRHAVDESEVGMALLVHHSFPDEYELANGVATLRQAEGERRTHMVSQIGANPVTNPIVGQVAEEVVHEPDFWGGPFGAMKLTLARASNLLQLGATVMEFPDDYEQLAELLGLVADEYERVSGRSEFTLEFEFKKEAPAGSLAVKQVRRVPEQDDNAGVTPFLINEPTEYCLFQHESDNIFADHRLRSRWTIETQSAWLTPAVLESGLLSETSYEYAAACQIREQSGLLSEWPEATHASFPGYTVEGWSFNQFQNGRRFSLRVPDPSPAAISRGPVLIPSDLGCLGLQADYDHPVTGSTTDRALLCPCSAPEVGKYRMPGMHYVLQGPGGVIIETETYTWGPARFVPVSSPVKSPSAPPGQSPMQTTTITGLTSTPVVLNSAYSQSFLMGHHAIGQQFVFEPTLEPGLSRQQRVELAAAGIRAIYVAHDYYNTQFIYFDDAAWGDSCLQRPGSLLRPRFGEQPRPHPRARR